MILVSTDGPWLTKLLHFQLQIWVFFKNDFNIREYISQAPDKN